jgi:hypothetical protein
MKRNKTSAEEERKKKEKDKKLLYAVLAVSLILLIIFTTLIITNYKVPEGKKYCAMEDINITCAKEKLNCSAKEVNQNETKGNDEKMVYNL